MKDVDESERLLYDRETRKRRRRSAHYKSEDIIMRFCTRRITGKENTAWDFFFGSRF